MLHTNAPIGSVLENYRSKAATAAIDRSKRVSDVTSSRLSSVTSAIDNDVYVRKVVNWIVKNRFLVNHCAYVNNHYVI